MKTQITKIKLSLAFCLMLLLPLGTFAAVPAPDPSIYVCGTGSVSLGYSGSYSLVAGDKVIWQEVSATGDPTGFTAKPLVFDGTATSVALTVLGGTDITAPGNHYWVASVVATAGTCTGGVSDPLNIYLLPPFTVDITPSLPTYCESAATKASLTAKATPTPAVPTGVTFVYDWAGSTGGAVDATDGGIYNMTATAAGTFNIAVKADFKVPTGKLLKSSTGGCGVSATSTYKVSSTPGAPTITFS